MIIQVQMQDMGYWESHMFMEEVSKLFGVDIERVD